MHLTFLDKLHGFSPLYDEKKILFFYSDHFKKEETLTLKELLDCSDKIGAYLTQHFEEQTTISIVFPPGLHLIQALIGCMQANLIPIITYPPTNKVATQHYTAVIEDAKPAAVLCEAKLKEKLQILNPAASIISIEEVCDKNYSNLNKRKSKPENIAFLQYTSGSTKRPRGVVITHKNLLSNLEIIRNYFRADETIKVVSWLPPYHDMGLIGTIFGTLYVCAEAHLFSPETFIRDPLSWIRLISKIKATHCTGPNFGYEMAAKKAKDASIADIDLSSLKIAGTGAEPVRAETLRTFNEVFKESRFDKLAFLPCYGLAENTLMATCVDSKSLYKTLFIHKNIQQNHPVKIEKKPSKDTLEIVSCGGPCCPIACIDTEKDEVCPEGVIGEIFISGPSVAKGYWHRDEETKETFVKRKDGLTYLKTGDLGFIYEGELYVTGRIKDLIIIAGKNFHPHDIEFAVGAAIQNNSVVVYSESGKCKENLVVVCGFRKLLSENEADDLVHQIIEAVVQEFNISVCKIYFLHQKDILRTPSGKPKRQLIKKKIQDQESIPLFSWEAAFNL